MPYAKANTASLCCHVVNAFTVNTTGIPSYRNLLHRLNPSENFRGETKAKGPAKAKTAQHFTSAAGFTAKQIFPHASNIEKPLMTKKHIFTPLKIQP